MDVSASSKRRASATSSRLDPAHIAGVTLLALSKAARVWNGPPSRRLRYILIGSKPGRIANSEWSSEARAMARRTEGSA